MTEQILKQEVMIDGQQVLSIATPDIVTNHVAETAPHSPRVTEVDPMKLQVMQNAVAKIEKAFGTCAIMRMNDESVEDVDVIPTGSIGLVIPVDASSKSTVPSLQAKPRWHSMPSPKPSRWVVSPPISTLNMLLTAPMPKPSG